VEDPAEDLNIILPLIQNLLEVETLLVYLCLKEMMVLAAQLPIMWLQVAEAELVVKQLLFLLLQDQEHVWLVELVELAQVHGQEIVQQELVVEAAQAVLVEALEALVVEVMEEH
tara:strand:+ start:1263 stop:1604 length:342 start_codon:yes stop_codon:yes gene_type:complete